jgi:hypothetical protein
MFKIVKEMPTSGTFLAVHPSPWYEMWSNLCRWRNNGNLYSQLEMYLPLTCDWEAISAGDVEGAEFIIMEEESE